MRLFRRGRRRRVIVDKTFQLRATLIGVIYIGAIAACLALPLNNMMKATNLLLEGHSSELTTLYKNQQTFIVATLIVFFVGLIVAWSLFTVWRTHKIAGPVVRLTAFSNQLAGGDLAARVKLRSADELKSLASTLNHMAESLERRERGISERITERIRTVRQKMLASPSMEHAEMLMDGLVSDVGQIFAEKQPPPAEPATDSQSAPEDLVRT